MKVLHIENLNISFTRYEKGRGEQILHPVRGLNLDACAGEVTAVVGASGSGKSLLAHGILGVLAHNAQMQGDIWYRGEKLTEERLEKLRGKEIVLVPQGLSHLDPMMQVGRQVTKGRKGKALKEKMREIFRDCHLSEDVEKQYPFELSGGMGRRILIATALIENPALVIADEPTPGLDPALARLVMSHFREFADRGAAVLVITHDLELAVASADRIVVLYEGTTVEETTPDAFSREETLKHPYTRALWRSMPEHGFAKENYEV